MTLKQMFGVSFVFALIGCATCLAAALATQDKDAWHAAETFGSVAGVILTVRMFLPLEDE